jgi:2'-5' RNA ligase
MISSLAKIDISWVNGLIRVVGEVDPGIAYYYRALIPEYFHAKPGRFAPHISIIRNETVSPPNSEALKYWDKREICFLYEPVVEVGEIYFWLNVYCDDAVRLRNDFGLPDHSGFTRPPDHSYCFHLTVGNRK